jgi:uncharacterized protein
VLGFCSVAEHSVIIARRLEQDNQDRRVVLGGLLHDAHEAYMGDMTWPMQQVLFGADVTGSVRAAYKRVKHGLDEAICKKIGLDSGWLYHSAVATYDLRVLLDERTQVLVPASRRWPVEDDYVRLGVKIEHWPPQRAAEEWLCDYHRLHASGQP